jgi:hypothetical protein
LLTAKNQLQGEYKVKDQRVQKWSSAKGGWEHTSNGRVRASAISAFTNSNMYRTGSVLLNLRTMRDPSLSEGMMMVKMQSK